MPGTEQRQDRRSGKGVGEGKKKGENEKKKTLARQVKTQAIAAVRNDDF